jgi:hypothetical protein
LVGKNEQVTREKEKEDIFEYIIKIKTLHV